MIALKFNNVGRWLMMDLEPHETSPMERHIQTIVAGVAVAILIWVGATLNTATQQTARLEERLSSLFREVQMLREQLGNQYTRHDAERDLSIVRARLEDQQRRLERLESKLSRVP